MKKVLSALLFACFLLSVLTATAQETSVPMQYYDRVQNVRDKASDLWGKQNPTPAEVAKSIVMLKKTVA